MTIANDLSSIPFLKGKSNTSVWLQAIELNLMAQDMWQFCEENITPETLKKHQATVKWLTPLLIAHIADQLHEQAMTEEIHKKNPRDVIK